MEKYRKKPVVIEAVQYPCEHPALRRCDCASRGDCACSMCGHEFIETLEGRMRVSPGDWIIRGVQGEHYPCKPDIFAATYEPADAAPQPPAEAQAQGGGEVVAWHIQHEDGLVALRKRDSVDSPMREQAAADGVRIRPLVYGDTEPPMVLIRKCRDALAEELAGWDIDPPLAHVKDAHDACVAFLSGDTAPPSAPVGDSLVQTALRNLPQYISKSGLVGPDKHSAMQCFEVLRAALAQQPAACAHSWHDYGTVNRAWCSRCNAVAVTGHEDRPYGVLSVTDDGEYRTDSIQQPAAPTRCDDCHEPTGSRAVCESCADIRCDAVSKQPAAVDGAAIRYALEHARDLDDGVLRVLAALAAQPGGSDNDR